MHTLLHLSKKSVSGRPCNGYCTACGIVHSLPDAPAIEYCYDLMQKLDSEKRIDFTVPTEHADPHLSTKYLFGEARGQMFGILVCQKNDGSLSTIKAFSGQFDGRWEVNGWAPPLFDVDHFHLVNYEREKEIKQLTRKIDRLENSSPDRVQFIGVRRKLSQQLMKDIHALYRLHNFNGQKLPLSEAFSGTNGIPTGTGDCCAPKLLNYAAMNNLKPISLAEFYWGRENKSGNRQHGLFYPSCAGKCQPILGFMLCGLEREP